MIFAPPPPTQTARTPDDEHSRGWASVCPRETDALTPSHEGAELSRGYLVHPQIHTTTFLAFFLKQTASSNLWFESPPLAGR